MIRGFLDELWQSSDYIFQNRLSWLLITGPIAILGQHVLFSEAACFTLAGIALIPCAERLSFVTEQVSLHTNASIGALLNATFGNAPELLIASAAIRSGFYRLTQLTMLGSMITNMVFVFGLSCFVGGLRWQTQELHVGSVVIAMLMLSTAGSLIPAALVLNGHFMDGGADKASSSSSSSTMTTNHHGNGHQRGLVVEQDSNNIEATAVVVDALLMSIVSHPAPSQEEITLSRVNAAVMLIAYLLYLIFQLGTHVEEERRPAPATPPRPNVACRRLWSWCCGIIGGGPILLLHHHHLHPQRGVGKKRSSNFERGGGDASWPSRGIIVEKRRSEVATTAECSMDDDDDDDDFDNNNEGDDDDEEADILLKGNNHQQIYSDHSTDPLRIRENAAAAGAARSSEHSVDPMRIREAIPPRHALSMRKSKESDHHNEDDDGDDDDEHERPQLSMRVGIFWLFVVTMCISAMSDILVNTIDGFAQRMRLSQVFTSMVIIPFFSNIAEQVSSVIFAYKNEMDLCVGVTIGSAIQIATFVLPGSVLMAMLMDRSMTLYFHSYETVCWFFCTVLVSLILLSKSSNWLVGAILILTYVMFAAGIWYHEIENLSVDAEDYDRDGIGGERRRAL